MQVTTDVLNSPAVAVLCGLEHAGQPEQLSSTE